VASGTDSIATSATLADVALHLAQLTDLHVQAPGAVNDLGYDSNAAVAVAVERVVGLSPLPDAIVLTGDLTDHGTAVEFEHLLALLAPWEMPILPIAGNHDERLGLADAFPGIERHGPEPFWQWIRDLEGIRLIGIDTTIEGRHDGELCATRLDWLDAELAAAPDRPTIICMHHPPFRTGIWWMDAGGLRTGADDLRAVVARHRQVRRIICGHHHRSIITSWGSTVVSVAPSTSHQIHFDLVPESPARCSDEEAAFHLHVCDGDDVVTHVVACPTPEIVDLGQVFGGWEAFRESLREGRPMHK
jgi:3',5'-cyclic AMP phosphodiesterase CpdA